MRIFFDASAWTKRYKRESGTDQVLALLGRASTVVLAAHARLEVASALARDLHDKVLAVDAYDHAIDLLNLDLQEVEILALDRVSEGFALAALRQRRLRAMDALHLGAAMASGVSLFVTADKQQADAAMIMGLKMERIGS